MKYWYKKYITQCPACGEQEIDRERQYTEKPENREDRETIRYYGCDFCRNGMYGI